MFKFIQRTRRSLHLFLTPDGVSTQEKDRNQSVKKQLETELHAAAAYNLGMTQVYFY